MIKTLSQLMLLAPMLLLSGSSGTARDERIEPAAIRISSRSVDQAKVASSPALRFIKGWELTSANKVFGGISALIRDRGEFIALSDIGAFIRFRLGEDGNIDHARVDPLPPGCLWDNNKYSRDTESMTADPISGNIWIGFESINAVCRMAFAKDTMASLYQPPDMHHWNRVRGPESMVRMRDGRFLVIAEEPEDGSEISPVLIFDRDPTDPAARRIHMRYIPPKGFRPTDAIEMPNGQLMILNRKFNLPFRFASAITLVNAPGRNPATPLKGPVIARLESPGIHDNFEALALSQGQGRTFIWLMSDDNYLPLQRTYLMLYEWKGVQAPARNTP